MGMIWGNGFFIVFILFVFGSIFFGIVSDPEVWEEVDLRIDIGLATGHEDDALNAQFSRAMMMNQDYE
tara:strand:- start:403 stop:606 length:204 start_codon:yes stop_codon:yes gene_type:complete